MEKALFPMKYYNLTQGYINSTTHQGTYALDNCGKDKGKDEIFAPFSCKVTKKYVKNGNTYTVWLTSLDKVLCANGKQEYLTILIAHPEDIINLKVGQVFKQGEVVCHEGKTGRASGNHAHLELGIGTCGWHKNNYGVYMIDNAVRLEEYLFLHPDAIVLNDKYNGVAYSFEREVIPDEKLKSIQIILNQRYSFNLNPDGIYGNNTHKHLIKALQTEINKGYGAKLSIDGIFGPTTKKNCPSILKGAKGNIVWLIQAKLYIKGAYINIDGDFGGNTDRIVKEYQNKNGLCPDGIVGPKTFESLFK